MKTTKLPPGLGIASGVMGNRFRKDYYNGFRLFFNPVKKCYVVKNHKGNKMPILFKSDNIEDCRRFIDSKLGEL